MAKSAWYHLARVLIDGRNAQIADVGQLREIDEGIEKLAIAITDFRGGARGAEVWLRENYPMGFSLACAMRGGDRLGQLRVEDTDLYHLAAGVTATDEVTRRTHLEHLKGSDTRLYWLGVAVTDYRHGRANALVQLIDA